MILTKINNINILIFKYKYRQKLEEIDINKDGNKSTSARSKTGARSAKLETKTSKQTSPSPTQTEVTTSSESTSSSSSSASCKASSSAKTATSQQNSPSPQVLVLSSKTATAAQSRTRKENKYRDTMNALINNKHWSGAKHSKPTDLTEQSILVIGAGARCLSFLFQICKTFLSAYNKAKESKGSNVQVYLKRIFNDQRISITVVDPQICPQYRFGGWAFNQAQGLGLVNTPVEDNFSGKHQSPSKFKRQLEIDLTRAAQNDKKAKKNKGYNPGISAARSALFRHFREREYARKFASGSTPTHAGLLRFATSTRKMHGDVFGNQLLDVLAELLSIEALRPFISISLRRQKAVKAKYSNKRIKVAFKKGHSNNKKEEKEEKEEEEIVEEFDQVYNASGVLLKNPVPNLRHLAYTGDLTNSALEAYFRALLEKKYGKKTGSFIENQSRKVEEIMLAKIARYRRDECEFDIYKYLYQSSKDKSGRQKTKAQKEKRYKLKVLQSLSSSQRIRQISMKIAIVALLGNQDQGTNILIGGLSVSALDRMNSFGEFLELYLAQGPTHLSVNPIIAEVLKVCKIRMTTVSRNGQFVPSRLSDGRIGDPKTKIHQVFQPMQMYAMHLHKAKNNTQSSQSSNATQLEMVEFLGTGIDLLHNFGDIMDMELMYRGFGDHTASKALHFREDERSFLEKARDQFLKSREFLQSLKAAYDPKKKPPGAILREASFAHILCFYGNFADMLKKFYRFIPKRMLLKWKGLLGGLGVKLAKIQASAVGGLHTGIDGTGYTMLNNMAHGWLEEGTHRKLNKREEEAIRLHALGPFKFVTAAPPHTQNLLFHLMKTGLLRNVIGDYSNMQIQGNNIVFQCREENQTNKREENAQAMLVSEVFSRNDTILNSLGADRDKAGNILLAPGGRVMVKGEVVPMIAHSFAIRRVLDINNRESAVEHGMRAASIMMYLAKVQLPKEEEESLFNPAPQTKKEYESLMAPLKEAYLIGKQKLAILRILRKHNNGKIPKDKIKYLKLLSKANNRVQLKGKLYLMVSKKVLSDPILKEIEDECEKIEAFHPSTLAQFRSRFHGRYLERASRI